MVHIAISTMHDCCKVHVASVGKPDPVLILTRPAGLLHRFCVPYSCLLDSLALFALLAILKSLAFLHY